MKSAPSSFPPLSDLLMPGALRGVIRTGRRGTAPRMRSPRGARPTLATLPSSRPSIPAERHGQSVPVANGHRVRRRRWIRTRNAPQGDSTAVRLLAPPPACTFWPPP